MINILKPTQITEISNLLINKEIGILPTDTIYGIHCLAQDKDSIKKIYELKQRPQEMPYITLISNPEDLKSFGVETDTFDLDQIKKYWPGPNTLILNNQSFRIPNNSFLKSVLKLTGPLLSTSANIHNQPNAKNIDEAVKYFGEAVDFYVDAGELHNNPSSIYRIQNNQISKIR